MYLTLSVCSFAFVAVLLPAADLTWREKPISQWDEEDAASVFSISPWVRSVTPQWVPDSGSEFTRRDSGDWQAGRPKEIGLAGIGIFGSQREAEAIERAHAKPQPKVVVVRWESALPIRVAKQKLGMMDVPLADEAHYAIVIYGIPILERPHSESQLKGIAFIRRDRKKDLKPSRVEILRQGDGTANVVYFFPRSEEITKRDGKLTFIAQIGRLFVAEYFYTENMQIRGTLEL